jgi:hypothetical protein
MRHALSWSLKNADVVIALTVAVLVSVLGLADFVSPRLLDSAVVLTLATLASVMLHDRVSRGSADDKVRGEVARANSAIAELPMRIAARTAIKALVAAEIGSALEEARRDTDRWFFKGATGTFMRLVTLPKCVEDSRRNRRALMVRMEILDPTDVRLCERYVRLYQSLADSKDAPENAWTTEETRAELFATILAACWYHVKFRLLDVEIGLSSAVTTFRWELSSKSMIMTQRGPRFPAMMIESSHPYYDCWNAELRISHQQARRVPIEKAFDALLSPEPTVAETRDLFAKLGLGLPGEYEDVQVSEIIRKALRDENRTDDPRGAW